MSKTPYAVQLKEAAERRKLIRRRYRALKSFARVAHEFGISRQRARAIVLAQV